MENTKLLIIKLFNTHIVMKKLISIKTDETQEVIYFTHKKGVDRIRKSDVIDVELLEQDFRSWYSEKNDASERFFNGLVTLLPLYAIIYFCYSFNWNIPSVLTFMYFTFCGFGVFNYAVNKRNTRRILKIYTLGKIFKFYIADDETYLVIYNLFKKEISKYLPKSGELFLFEKNPSFLNYHIFCITINILLFLVSLYMLFAGQYYSLPIAFIIVNIMVAIIGMVYHFPSRSFQKKNYCEVTFSKNQLSVKSKWEGEEENLILFNYNKINLIKKDDKIAIVDTLVLDNGVPYSSLRRPNIFDKRLVFAEEFRDLAPIMIAYINMLSDEQINAEENTY